MSKLLQLDAPLLKSVGDLELVARQLVAGFLQGQHRSPLRGVSQEFMAYRPYLPGDPLKEVDWKVWARSDHLFIRQFRHESNFRAYCFLDASRSMDYGAGATNKFAYGRMLVACLSSLMLAQLDAPGVAIMGRPGTLPSIQPSTRTDHLGRICGLLGETAADGAIDGLGDTQALLADCKRRSLAIVVSDGFFPPDEGRAFLEGLRLRDMDVLFFHLLAPEEMRPDFNGEILLVDSETGEERVVDGQRLRADYAPRLERFLASTEELCLGLEIQYCRIVTDEPLDKALHRYLSQREMT